MHISHPYRAPAYSPTRPASVSSSVATLISNNPTLTVHSDTSHQCGTLVHRLFEGTLTSETRCLTCETVSRRPSLLLSCLSAPSSFRCLGVIYFLLAIHGSTDTDPSSPSRCPRAMNRSSTSPLTLSKIRVSPHACDSSVPARCCASGTNSFAIAAAGCRKPRSGRFCHLWFFRTHVMIEII